jgi:hypothetical protein
VIGPYELHDFFLYYTLRFGYAPQKVAYLAWSAWRDDYGLAVIRKWLGVPAPLLPDQPVQGSARAQLSEGGLGRLALAARRLARALGRQRGRLARRPEEGAADTAA